MMYDFLYVTLTEVVFYMHSIPGKRRSGAPHGWSEFCSFFYFSLKVEN